MDIIEELGGGKEDAFGFGGVAILSNVYFKAKACKVAMHKGEAFNQGITGGEGEGTIIDIKELAYFIGGEFAGSVHVWGVAPHTAIVEFVGWSVGHGQYFDACLVPCSL